MAEKDSCSIGLILSEVEKCNHSTTVNKEEKLIICWRSDNPVNPLLTTSMFDKSRFLVKYISNQTKCCDPFKLQIPSNTQNQGKVSLYKTLKHIQTHLMTKQNNDIQKKTEQELPDFYCFHFLSFIS